MPRPTDVSSRATAESRRKGAQAANAKRRELGLTLPERIARQLEQRAEELVDALVRALQAGEHVQVMAAVEAIERALEAPHARGALPEAELVETPYPRFARFVATVTGRRACATPGGALRAGGEQ